jgi:protein-tyrosine phosphatase
VPAIDLHSHVLPGIDDGPTALEDSLEMCRQAVADGTGAIAATPHVGPMFPTRSEVIAVAVARLNEILAEQDVPLDVLAGAEIAPALLPSLEEAEVARLSLGGGPYLLIEAPLQPVGLELEEAIEEVMSTGHSVLLAHPERAPSFHREPQRLEALVERGVLCSITAGSFIGRFGRPVARFTQMLFADGLVHSVASDAHDPLGRTPDLRSCLTAAGPDFPGLEAHADWLIEAVPAAIVGGTEVPSPPTVPAPARRSLRSLSWPR